MIRRAQIQALSATALATAASVSAIFLEPYLSSATLYERSIAVAIGVPLLYAVFRISEIVLRYLYYRRILGEWYYVTISSTSYVDQNYASMTFHFRRNGTLGYTVQLYRDRNSLMNGENPRGKAISEALDYDAENHELHILYNMNLLSDPTTRRGRLFLTHTKQKTLIGDWSSAVSGSTASRGRMFATRPKDDFESKSESWIESIGASS